MKKLQMITAVVLMVLGVRTDRASGQGLTTLYSFDVDDINNASGAFPLGGLVQGTNGNFYGTANQAGQSLDEAGTVFEISSSGTFNFTFLSDFGNGNNGRYPAAGLVLGGDGNFYGTTQIGGSSSSGTVFRISQDAGGITIIHSFNGDFSGSDGANPVAGLVQGSDGYFYGTTSSGGAHNTGTVFKISSGGSFSNLHSFSSSDGADPVAGLVQGSDGYFYGTTSLGGVHNTGTVFRISSDGSFSTVYSFSGSDGANPRAGLVQGSDGNFYGTTSLGGAHNTGIVFRISSDGSFSNLHSFSSSDGAYPTAGLVLGSDGNFYGTTFFGGGVGSCAGGCGTAFRISPSGAFSSLYSFSGGADGGNPSAGLVQGIDGLFYGTTENGGDFSGTMFALSVPLSPPANQIAKIQVFSIFGGMDIAVQIPTVVGETYQLQYSNYMNPTNWINTGGTMTGIGGSVTLFDSIGMLPPQRFYRAAIAP